MYVIQRRLSQNTWQIFWEFIANFLDKDAVFTLFFFTRRRCISFLTIRIYWKLCHFDTKFGYLGPKVIFLSMEQITTITRATTFHWDHPQKISVSELGVIFWGLPLFLAVLGLWHDRGATTLNFGPISTKLGGTVRAIKKMTQKDNGPCLGRNYGETGVFTFDQKVVFGLKMGFTPKNHPKWYFPPWLFGQRHFFSLNNFFRSWPEHG